MHKVASITTECIACKEFWSGNQRLAVGWVKRQMLYVPRAGIKPICHIFWASVLSITPPRPPDVTTIPTD